MERRILKDFHIGIVEGIIKDVISKESKPKDVFSQIAKAIVRRGSTDRYASIFFFIGDFKTCIGSYED